MYKKIFAAALVMMTVSACSTITIQPKKIPKLSTAPTYEERKNFYMWGLVGEERVDVTKICNGSKVKQMQSQATFVDGLLGTITLGIYAPHTVKVWCDK